MIFVSAVFLILPAHAQEHRFEAGVEPADLFRTDGLLSVEGGQFSRKWRWPGSLAFTSANDDLHEGRTLHRTAGHRVREPTRIDCKPTHTDV